MFGHKKFWHGDCGVFSAGGVCKMRKTQKALVVLLVCLFLGVAGSPTQAVKPMVPLKVDLELLGEPRLGVEIPVRLKVRSWTNASRVRIQCRLPEGVQMVSGQETWEGEMAAGEVKEITLILEVRKPGRYVLQAVASIESPDAAVINQPEVLMLDLRDAREKAEFEKQEKKKKRLIIREEDGRRIIEFPRD